MSIRNGRIYANLAFLSAQIRKLNAAIYYMKKYLLPEPESSDACIARIKFMNGKPGLLNSQQTGN